MEPVTVWAAPQKVSFMRDVRLDRRRSRALHLRSSPHAEVEPYGRWICMARRALAAAMLVVLLIPAAHLAWVARDMPHLGHLHDDSIYWVAAKSLAQGHGYRILSLPQQPFETKYPPLFALALSLIWRLNPQFPENLQLATVFAWVWLPIFLSLAWIWFRRAGFELRGRVALCAVLALSPWLVFLSTTLM